ncbi:hypothetical protein ACLMJK_002134 [Lecanora helva]
MSIAVMSPPGETGDIKMEIDHPDSKQALTPPTSESTGKKGDDDDDSGSELSDLEPEEPVEESVPAQKVKQEEEEDQAIVPDHYYEGGKIPVFKPTMRQFRSFKDFIQRIDKYGMKSGIVKVIPPKEWRDALPQLDQQVKTIKVKNPITQEFHGTQGTYTQANIEKQRSYNLPQWKALCEESSNQPPAKRGERRRNQDKPSRAASTRTRSNAGSNNNIPKKRGPGRPRIHPEPASVDSADGEADEVTDDNKDAETPLTPTSPPLKATKARKEVLKGDAKQSVPKPKGRQPKAGQAKSVSSRRQHNRRDQADVVDEEAFKNFDYRIHNQEEWTTERVQELERLYWKSLNFSNPMYGADMPGSLFDDSTKDWNVAKLENLLDVLGQNVPGVNTAYLYLGMWKASFAWHLEDVDLYSINYIHFGAPKQWYSISQADARKFEAAMRTVWPNDSKNCDQFLRHKTYLISPEKLQQQHHIQVNRLVHHEGEFVITFPYGYHSGYNLGYNCAESVNFATDSWLDYGRIARKCNCEADSVWVDVREIERKLRGEPTPEYYEETDDDDDEDDEDEPTTLPTPPGSVKGKPKRSYKRKQESTGKDTKPRAKKLRLKIKAPSYEPCVLCPNDHKYEKLLPTDNGKQAHRRCALYTPETYISDEKGQETVRDISQIDKARLEMKCYYCRSKKGSVFQCSQKKCVRAYHATCAAQAGVLVDIGLVPVFGEDGTEYTDTGIDFRCKIHRGKRGKHVDGAVLEEVPLIRKTASKLPIGEVAQFQYLQGEIFAGVILENRKSEQTLLIELLPKGDRFEVEYKWLLVFDPVNSQLPMPSENAKPLPAELARKSRTTAEDPAVNEGPKPNELFCDSDAFRWEEFETRKAFRNPSQVQIDLSKPKKLWFYLGKTSTEAKAQYTGDLKIRQNDPSANFLESVRIASIAAAAAAAPLQRKSLSASYPSSANHNAANPSSVSYQSQYGNTQSNTQTKPPVAKDRPYNGKYAITDPIHPTYQYKPRIGYNVDNESLRNQRAFTQASSMQPQWHGYNSSAQQYPTYRAPQAPTATMTSTHSKIPQAFQGTPEYRPGSGTNGQFYPSSTHNFQRPAPYQPPQAHMQQPQQPNYTPSPQLPTRPQAYQTQCPPLKAPVANMMGSAVKSETPTLDETPFSRPSSGTQSPSAAGVPPTSSTIAPPAPETKGVSHLPIHEKYSYLHDAEKARPPVYQSPYAPEGGFTEAYLPAPAINPKSRPRGPSISEGYLMKRTVSQQEEVNRKLNEDKRKSYEESQARAKFHEQQQAQRRQSFGHDQNSSRSDNIQNSHYQQRPQHIPMSAVHQPQSSYQSPSQSYPSPYAPPNTYQSYNQYSPYSPQGLSHHSQPSSQYQKLQHYQQPPLPYNHHPPTYPSSGQSLVSPTGLQFQSPQDFQMQIQRDSQHHSPHGGGFDHFLKGVQSAADSQSGEGGWRGYNGSGQGSPLKNEMGGGGETLPVMREGSRY